MYIYIVYFINIVKICKEVRAEWNTLVLPLTSSPTLYFHLNKDMGIPNNFLNKLGFGTGFCYKALISGLYFNKQKPKPLKCIKQSI